MTVLWWLDAHHSLTLLIFTHKTMCSISETTIQNLDSVTDWWCDGFTHLNFTLLLNQLLLCKVTTIWLIRYTLSLKITIHKKQNTGELLIKVTQSRFPPTSSSTIIIIFHYSTRTVERTTRSHDDVLIQDQAPSVSKSFGPKIQWNAAKDCNESFDSSVIYVHYILHSTIHQGKTYFILPIFFFDEYYKYYICVFW